MGTRSCVCRGAMAMRCYSQEAKQETVFYEKSIHIAAAHPKDSLLLQCP